jgi:Mg/Co/Ni transporter MgtE
MLPLPLERLGMDPTVSSAPFIATLADVAAASAASGVGLAGTIEEAILPPKAMGSA